MVESRRSTKIGKHKKTHNLFVWSPNRDPFFVVFKGHYKLTLKGVFRVRRVHLVPPIVDLGFLYPYISQIFYQQSSLKKLKIRCCRSCCYKINYCWWSKALSGISKSQTWVLRATNSDRIVCGFGAVCGHVIKYYKR